MVKEWSKSLLAMILVGALSGTTAIITTNRFLATSILFVAFTIIALYSLDREGKFSVGAVFPSKAKAEDPIEFTMQARSESGFGFYLVELPLPEAFLLREGSNIHAIFKGFRKGSWKFTFRAAGMRRGTFLLDHVNYTYYPALGVINKKDGKLETGGELEILPKLSIPKLRVKRLKSEQVSPKNSISRTGPISSDFESVREYQAGDSYRNINWKATARNSFSNLMVNQYEREGEKTLIYLLDRSFPMSRGTAEENPLEYGISFIFAHSRALMKENINTGFWTAQSGRGFSSQSVMPSSGIENEYRFRKALLRTEPLASKYVVYQVDPKFFTVVRETRATVLFITSVWKENYEELSRFIRRIRKYSGNVLLVNVLSSGIIMKHILSGIEAFYGKKTALRNSSRFLEELPRIRRVDWDPINEPLGYLVGSVSMVTGI